MLHDVMESLQGLNLTNLTATPTMIGNPPVLHPAHPSSLPTTEPSVPPPEHYSVDLGTCGCFLLQVSFVFERQLSSYPSDKARIAYVMNALSGVLHCGKASLLS